MFRVVAITIVIFVATFWMWHAFSMGDMMHMNDCPFMDSAALCSMSPMEHLAILKSLLVASFQNQIMFALVFAVFILMDAAPPLRKVCILVLFSRRASFFEKLFSLSKPLQEAFSSGILDPKIYRVVAL